MIYMLILCLLLLSILSLVLSLEREAITQKVLKYRRNQPYYYDDPHQTPIEQWDTSRVTDMSYLFVYSTINVDLSSWDTSNVTSMQGMFHGASIFNNQVNMWNVSKVTNMHSMFNTAISFNQDLSEWDVSKVENMHGMFSGASYFDQELKNWNVHNVKDMSYMFNGAIHFNENISEWDMSNIETMDGIFYGAYQFNQVLCWNIDSYDSISTEHVFDGSLGRFGTDKECPNNNKNEYETYSPTMRPMSLPTISPINIIMTYTPTRRPISNDINNLVYTSNQPTEMKRIFLTTESSTNTITHLPTLLPTHDINILDYSSSYTHAPIWIISSISNRNTPLCIRPYSFNPRRGTKLSLSSCQSSHIFKWIINYDGNILSYLDPLLCITMIGKRIFLDTCQVYNNNQKLLYNWMNNRLVSMKNGQRGVVVVSNFHEYSIQGFNNLRSHVYEFEQWSFKNTLDNNVINYYDHPLSLPHYYIFRIKSHIKINDTKWCIYPQYNTILNGIRLSLSSCKRWNSHKWMMDPEGKIMSVKAPDKCIARMGKNIILDTCQDENMNQMWVYNLLDRSISVVRNGLLKVTVEKQYGSENGSIKLLSHESPSPVYQQWKMEEF